MAANTNPIFGRTPQAEWGSIINANTAKDGTGTVVTVFTGDASEGSYLEKIRVRSMGANAVSVMRFFLNNGSTNATAANNTLLDEVTLHPTALTEVAAMAGITLPMNIPIPAGYKVNVTVGTAGATGWAVTGIGAKY